MWITVLGVYWWILVLLGLGTGFLGGLLGIGGGIVMVPVFAELLKFDQKTAQGTALSVMVPMALVAALGYWCNPQLKLSWGLVFLVAVGAVAGAWGGSLAAKALPSSILRHAFAVFIILVGVYMLVTKDPRERARAATEAASPAATSGGADNGSVR